MHDTAIRVESLGKQYHIGTNGPENFRQAIKSSFMWPFRAIKHFLDDTPTSEVRKDDTIWALRDVSFHVNHGEVVGIIGHNGAGKSTLLKILSGITKPTEGTVTIHGRVGSLLEVGTGFHPELTGRENIYLNGAILGMQRAEIESKFDDIVAFADIERFLDTSVKHYSSGMYVRLAFAVAAHLEPEILIIDEVLAVGDAAFQQKCLGKMNSVAGKGRTVLFVSHNMAAISQICQRAVWLEKGRIVQQGNVEKIVKSYISSMMNHQKVFRHWNEEEAPGDDRIRLLGLQVCQGSETTSVIDINHPFEIEMDFRVLKKAHNLVTGVTLYNEQGICLFDSCDWKPNHLMPGTYRKRVRFPPQLMAEGWIEVLIEIFFDNPNISCVHERGLLSFSTIDSHHPKSVRGRHRGNWPGVMRIRLDWGEAQRIREE
jgi:lipopolysaccharide transport system ATP-binding protein